MFYYEARTIRGIGLLVWALLIQLSAVVATGASLVALALVLGPALANPPAFLTSVLGILAAACGIELSEVAMVIVFLVGFHQVHAGRHEYGIDHARSLDRSVLFLVLFAAVELANTAYLVSSNPFVPSVGVSPSESLLVGNIAIAPAGACFAGLTLYYSVRSLAGPPDRHRLVTGVLLGIAGAATGPILLTLATGGNPRDVSAIVSGLLASAIAGDGMAAVSLAVFILIFRDLRRDLIGGRPQPALPRIGEIYPWLAPPPAHVQAPDPGTPLQPPPNG